MQEDEGDESEEDIELHRQDGDHDLFAEEEEEEESLVDPNLQQERPADRLQRA